MAKRRPTNITTLFLIVLNSLQISLYFIRSSRKFAKAIVDSVCGVDNTYYRVSGKSVEIMAVIGQQDLDEWL
jgi:hypothetical protein